MRSSSSSQFACAPLTTAGCRYHQLRMLSTVGQTYRNHDCVTRTGQQAPEYKGTADRKATPAKGRSQNLWVLEKLSQRDLQNHTTGASLARSLPTSTLTISRDQSGANRVNLRFLHRRELAKLFILRIAVIKQIPCDSARKG
jgi:hypothetical protein